MTAAGLWRLIEDAGTAKSRILLETNSSGKKRPKGDALSVLHYATVEGELLLITLKSRKVYVAMLLKSPDLSGPDYVLPLMPWWSGYRSEENMSVEFTTFYNDGFDDDDFKNIDTNEFRVLVPMSEVQSIQIFDPNYYESVFTKDEGQGETDLSEFLAF